MRKLIIILLFISTFVNAQVKEYNVNIKQDAIDHFAASFIISGVSSSFLYDKTGNKFWATVGGLFISSSVGLGKELLDSNFSKRDMKNNLLGSISGALTVRLIIGKAKHRKHFTTEQLIEAGY